MVEVNPYRLQYIPTQDHSQQLYEQMLQPQHAMQQHTENEFRNREMNRTESRDRNTDERDRVGQEQRARQMLMEDKRSGQREELYSKQEDRRQADAMFNRKKLHQAEHEALIHELFEAINMPGQDSTARTNRIMAAQDALHRAGYGTSVNEDTPSGPSLPPPIQAPPPAPAAPRAPMSPADAATSKQLDKAEAEIVPKLTGKAKGSPAKDAALSKQLDSADAKYTKGLSGSAPMPWRPGISPVRQSADVAQSDAMLDPDDPYNKLVQ